MADCRTCGRPVAWKNRSGHYRDKCERCARKEAGDRDRHVDLCTDPDCPVCAAVAEETAGVGINATKQVTLGDVDG